MGATYYPLGDGRLTRKGPKLPPLPRGGNRCPDCKHGAPKAGEHHVCLDGRCTVCTKGARAA